MIHKSSISTLTFGTIHFRKMILMDIAGRLQDYNLVSWESVLRRTSPPTLSGDSGEAMGEAPMDRVARHGLKPGSLLIQVNTLQPRRTRRLTGAASSSKTSVHKGKGDRLSAVLRRTRKATLISKSARTRGVLMPRFRYDHW